MSGYLRARVSGPETGIVYERSAYTHWGRQWQRLLTHIQGRYERLIGYYGVYSSRSIGTRRAKAPGAEREVAREKTPPKHLRRQWQRRLQRVFGVTLSCPTCGTEMKIIAVITQDEPIHKILAHLKSNPILVLTTGPLPLSIPPLRDRRADIPILISHFIEKYSAEEKKHIGGVASDALNLLVSYDWPGNVRELLNEIRRAVTLAEDGDRISLGLLSGRVKKQLLGLSESSDADELGSTLPELMALKEAHRVKTRAARQLGIHEAILRGKMRRYGLESPVLDD